MTPDARELHRVITASVRELLETARLEVQTGAMNATQVERLIFRAAAPIVHSVAPLTEAQRGRAAAAYRPRDVGGFPRGASAMTAAKRRQDLARLLEGPGEGECMKIAARLVALLLLLVPATASAECAWVLWVRHEEWLSTDIEDVLVWRWEPHSTYKTVQGCEERQAIELERPGTTRWRCIPATHEPHGRKKDGAVTTVPCLPDTVDPRVPKGK